MSTFARPTNCHENVMLTIQSNVSLKAHNTFGIDVMAKYLVETTTESDIHTLLQLPNFQNTPKLILGGGSNLLFTQNFDGLVVKLELKGIEVINETDDYVWVKAGAGENWHDLVMYCVERNYGGIENLSLIPGTVGAAPIQNIGAYGVELKDTFVSLEAIDLVTGEMSVFTRTDCNFGYRDSIFKREAKGKYIITKITLLLNKTPIFKTDYGDIQKTLEQMGVKELNIKAISNAVVKIRSGKLPNPTELGNAGSFFKNPEITQKLFLHLSSLYPDIPNYPTKYGFVKIPAAWLIEQCGWKGRRVGNVGVHYKQALVLVNYGHGEGTEIKRLADDIVVSVQEKFGIKLSQEVNVI